MRLVLVEDHDALRELLALQLREVGFEVFTAYDAEAIDDELAGVEADAYLVDIGLPGEDGLSLAARLRTAQPDVGIVILTGRSGVEDRVAGYESGADVYLSKPVDVQELVAVLRSIQRRRAGSERTDFLLDPLQLELSGPQGVTRVSPAQADLLAAFAQAPGHRLETWQAMERIGKSPDTYPRSALAVHFARLRECFEVVGASRDAITSVRGVGYQLRIDLAVKRSDGPRSQDEDAPAP